jgi:2-methylcitrate dehydratase PrpD
MSNDGRALKENDMGATRKIAAYVAATQFHDLPAEVVREGKLCFLDWLSVTLAGAREADIDSLAGVIALVGGEAQASVIGRPMKTSILNAALLNGMISHALDFDDTSVEFLGHPSVTLFPGILAAAEWKRESGKAFLTAYVLGYETGCRVALGASPNHYLAGWHGTCTIGHFAAAAGTAKLLGLSADELVHAMGTAGTQASGIKAVFGTSCKPFHAGKASFDGLLAALLAQRGFTSMKDILEGQKGFWEMFSTAWQEDDALKGFGVQWHILKNNYKFHASCYGTHAPIEAALALKKAAGIDVGKIDRINIHVSRPMLDVAGKEKPETGLEAKFSIPYSVANALLNKDTGMNAFTDERVHDPATVALQNYISLVPDDALAPFEAEISVDLEGGTLRQKFDMLAYVMDQQEKEKKIVEKFLALGEFVFKSERLEQIVARVLNLEAEENMADWMTLLT